MRAKARKGCKNEKFDFIITDHEMPSMSGYDFARKIRANKEHARVPIIVLSSVNRHVLEKLYEMANVQEIIQKDDFEQKRFIEIIDKYMKAGIDYK